MRKKYKILLCLFAISMLLFSSGITYSIFNSGAAATMLNQKIAKFIFNAEKVDFIELPLVDLNPGSVEEYYFSVTNADEKNMSSIAIEYQIVIKTYHFMPLNIELYKIGEDDSLNLLMECGDDNSRNSKNEVVCNSKVQQMLNLNDSSNDRYKIRIEFPEEYNSEEYSNLVDFIDLEINSWQKIKEKPVTYE